MIILCNGERLELSEKAELSFKRTNYLYAFSASEKERTQSFTLPSTPHNERILALAKVPAFSGDRMRVKLPAEIQEGAVVKTGYIYVDKFSAKNGYSCIFVSDELDALAELRNAGTLREIYRGENVTCSEDTEWLRPYEIWTRGWASQYLFYNVRHIGRKPSAESDWKGHPSISLTHLVQKCAQEVGISVDWSGFPRPDDWRIIPKEVEGDKEDEVNFVSSPIANAGTTGGDCNSVNQPTDYLIPTKMWLSKTYFRDVEVDGTHVPRYTRGEKWFPIWGWRTTKPIDITCKFKNDGIEIQQYYGLITEGIGETCLWGGPPMAMLSGANSKIPRLKSGYTNGRIAFDTSSMPTLGSGQVITIPAGTAFAFIPFHSIIFYNYPKDGSERVAWDYGSIGNLGHSFDETLKVRTSGTQEHQDTPRRPAIWSIYDNLPDVSLYDAMQSIASQYGMTVGCNATGGIIFRDYAPTGKLLDISPNVISVDEVTRDVGKFAQHNVVKFADDESLTQSEVMQVDYAIANDNLSADPRTLYTIPFSEGGSASVLTYGRIDPDSVYVYARYDDKKLERDILCTSPNGTADYLVKRPPVANNALTKIMQAATTVTVQVRWTLAEYMRMTEDTRILLDNMQYVWLEMSWAKGVAKLTLAKYPHDAQRIGIVLG